MYLKIYQREEHIKLVKSNFASYHISNHTFILGTPIVAIISTVYWI